MDYKKQMCKLLELPESFADDTSEVSEEVEPNNSGGMVAHGCTWCR